MPLATPPASPARGTAAARDAPRYRTASARAAAGLRELVTAPAHTACPGHQRWDTFSNSRGSTVISPPGLAVSLCRRTPWRWGIVETHEALGVVGLEPLANRMLIALVALGNLWHAPALGIE